MCVRVCACMCMCMRGGEGVARGAVGLSGNTPTHLQDLVIKVFPKRLEAVLRGDGSQRLTRLVPDPA